LDDDLVELTMTLRAAACVFILVPLVATAAPDAREGRRLVQNNKCETCHQDKVYGPVGTIYLRKDRKVTSWAKLNAQVAACNTMLSSGLFPEEEAHIAAFLNETYYKLPLK
jgi:cytochrome c5